MATATNHPITRDTGLHGGAPVFTCTRIAVKILFGYLAEGQSVNDFVKQYPSMPREQAIAAIEEVGGIPERRRKQCA